jgi:hypothetical protein
MFILSFLLRMTDTITSQNIDLSSWDDLYITRLASKEIFSPSNKIHREVGWAKDLSSPLNRNKITANPKYDKVSIRT